MPKTKLDTEAKKLVAQIRSMIKNGDVKFEGTKPARDFFMAKINRLADLADNKAAE